MLNQTRLLGLRNRTIHWWWKAFSTRIGENKKLLFQPDSIQRNSVRSLQKKRGSPWSVLRGLTSNARQPCFLLSSPLTSYFLTSAFWEQDLNAIPTQAMLLPLTHLRLLHHQATSLHLPATEQICLSTHPIKLVHVLWNGLHSYHLALMADQPK